MKYIRNYLETFLLTVITVALTTFMFHLFPHALCSIATLFVPTVGVAVTWSLVREALSDLKVT